MHRRGLTGEKMNNETTEKGNGSASAAPTAAPAKPAAAPAKPAPQPPASAKDAAPASAKSPAAKPAAAPPADKKAKNGKERAPAANTRLSEMRHDPTAIRRVFETGEYPYAVKMRAAPYEERMMELQRELLKAQRWVEESGEKIVILF